MIDHYVLLFFFCTAKAGSLEKELDITSKNCKNYKSKAEELQIKLNTLQDYFRLQEIDLHR